MTWSAARNRNGRVRQSHASASRGLDRVLWSNGKSCAAREVFRSTQALPWRRRTVPSARASSVRRESLPSVCAMRSDNVARAELPRGSVVAGLRAVPGVRFVGACHDKSSGGCDAAACGGSVATVMGCGPGAVASSEAAAARAGTKARRSAARGAMARRGEGASRSAGSVGLGAGNMRRVTRTGVSWAGLSCVDSRAGGCVSPAHNSRCSNATALHTRAYRTVRAGSATRRCANRCDEARSAATRVGAKGVKASRARLHQPRASRSPLTQVAWKPFGTRCGKVILQTGPFDTSFASNT